MLAVLAGEAAAAQRELAAIVARTRDNPLDALPFDARRLSVRFEPQLRPAGLEQVFFSAERLEFVEQSQSSALAKYKSLLTGTLDPTQQVIALRNIARLNSATGSEAEALAALRDAVRIRGAADEERLLAFYELAEHDDAESQRLVAAIEEGEFVGVRPGRRAHIHEKLGGDGERRLALHAAEALLAAESSDDVVALPGRKAAWRLEKRKRDFLWSITHEFKTPIANILLYAETIHNHGGKDPERVGGFAQTIGAEAQRLLDMVQQALGVAAGKESAFARKERFDLCAVVKSVIADHRSAAARRSIDLDLVLPDAPIHLIGMKDFVARALSGLLDNAVKFAARRVRVAVTSTGQSIVIDVDDDGPGFAQSDREKIFEPFVQLGDSATRTATGTGLGLSLVRQCVENGGGRVIADRSALGGALFRIEYPRSLVREPAGHETDVPR